MPNVRCRARRRAGCALKIDARAEVPPFAIMEIIAARQHVLNLAAGEPAGSRPGRAL
jgi:hypothetical protein